MTDQESHYDVVVAGGGMVGSMLAAALAYSRLRVAVLEPGEPAPFSAEAPHDLRVSAISMASERMLKAVGAWAFIQNCRACAYRHMLVWDGEQGGKTRFYSGDIGQTHLGHIVENRVLQLALNERLRAADNIDFLCPLSLQSMRVEPSHVLLELSDSRTLTARLLVGADGARSRVRSLAGIESDSFAYPQHALVASIRTRLPQQAITWQRFVPSGPQAFLPLSGSNASIVWYHSEQEVSRLQALPEQAFVNELEAAFPSELGGVQGLHARGSFPLFRSHARDYVKSRIALIGDAAHSVHPLAGQGVNLGLLDAAVLAEVILDSAAAQGDIGEYGRLRRYQRWRRFDNELMINTLDGFYRAFRSQPAPLRLLRSLALDTANRCTPLKKQVTAYAMGLSGDLPKLATGAQAGDRLAARDLSRAPWS